MSLTLQYAIVFVIVVLAAWVSWRKLRGRRVFRSGREPDACAGCGSADEHRH